MKKKKSGYESGFVKAKKKKLGDEGWAKLVDKVNAEEREKKRARFKQPEVDLQKIKDACTLEMADKEFYKDFEIGFELSHYYDAETGEEKKTSTTLLQMRNKVTDDMKFTLENTFKIYKNGNTDEILEKALKWMRRQPRIIKQSIRDIEAIDANKDKNEKLFKNTFHACGLRFKGGLGGGVMNRKK
jgi:hypothetical protein